MRNLFIIMSCCITFIILGCSDFKSKSDPEKFGSAKGTQDQEVQDPSIGKEIDPTIAQQDEEKRIQMIKEKIQSMSNAEKRKYIKAKELKACMYYTHNKNLVPKDKDLFANLEKNDYKFKIATPTHHRCNNAEYKVFFNSQEHSQVLNLNNGLDKDGKQRSVKGIKNTDKVYEVPFTTDTAVLEAASYDPSLLRDDNLHTIIDVPGTLFDELTLNKENKLDVSFDCNVFDKNGNKKCNHSDQNIVQVSVIGAVDVEIDGVKVPYYVRSANISARPTEHTFIDLDSMDITLQEPEFDDWCNPYVGDDDPWMQPDKDLVAIHNWDNATKIEHIGKIARTDVCMAYVNGFYYKNENNTKISTSNHYCNKAQYEVTFNDRKKDKILDLNNELDSGKQRSVVGLSSTDEKPVSYLVPGSTDEIALYRENRYKVFREDNMLHKIVDVPGTVFSVNTQKEWDDDLKLDVKLTCTVKSKQGKLICPHDTNKIVNHSLKGVVYVFLNGVSIPYNIRDGLKVTSPNDGFSYDMHNMTLLPTASSFDDWCRIIPRGEEDAIASKDKTTIDANTLAQPNFQQMIETVNSMNDADKLALIDKIDPDQFGVKVCMGYRYKTLKTDGIDTTHSCSNDIFDVYFNNTLYDSQELNLNNGGKQDDQRRNVTGINGKSYWVPERGYDNLAATKLREDGKHKNADVPGVEFNKELTWNDGKLTINTTCKKKTCTHALGNSNQVRPIIAFSLISQVDLKYKDSKNKVWYLPHYYVSTNDIKHIYPQAENTFDITSSDVIERNYSTPAGQTFNKNDLNVLNYQPAFNDWCEIIPSNEGN